MFTSVRTKSGDLKTPKKYPSEYLSRDILEEDFLNSFMPIHIIQMILGTSRVDARHRFVTSPTIYQRIYSAVVVVFVAICLFIFVNFISRRNASGNVSLYFLTAAGGILQFFMFVFNLFDTRFLNSRHNLRLFLKLQQVDRSLNIHHVKILYKIMFNRHLLTIFIVLILYILLTITSYLTIFNYVLVTYRMVVVLAVISFHIELGLFASIISFLTIRLKFLNEILNIDDQETNNVKFNYESIFFLINDNVIKTLANDSKEFNLICSNTAEALEEILEAFSLVRTVYKNQILSFTISFILLDLIMMENVIVGLQKKIFSYMDWMDTFTLIVINMSELLMLAVTCEGFIREVKKTKYICIHLLSLYYEEPLWDKTQDMLRVIEEKSPNFSVYGMFTLDGTLPINILAFTATYSIILLQFAFL